MAQSGRPPPAPETLFYPRRRTHGRLEVRIPDGDVVAHARVPRVLRSRFVVTTPDGALLCRGGGDGPFRGSWSARDASGTQIIRVRRTRRRRRDARTYDGWPRYVDKSPFEAGWRLCDASGRVVLLAQARGAFSLFVRPAYLVHRFDPRLSLAEVVALVEINWQISSRERSNWTPG